MTTETEQHVVIIGAGHAGGTIATLLREKDKASSITLIGTEPVPPYQRPPLSKAWLAGKADDASLALKPASYYAAHDIDLRLGVTADAIDIEARTVTLHDRSTVGWTQLVFATGARARMLDLPGIHLAGVVSLRSSADATALKGVLEPGGHIAIIGGGYVGLEVAASARGLGVAATVLEREPRLLARVACKALSDFFELKHRAHGVQFVFNAGVVGIEGSNGRVSGLQMADGAVLPCTAVLVGVGAIPNDDLASAAGIDCANGIIVDEVSRTSHPEIYAIGDVTWRPMPHYGRMARLESVPNAIEQARQVVAALRGIPAPKHEVPWFWSDQYDIKLQIAGVAFESTASIVRGDPLASKFAVFHLLDDKVVAVEAVNAPSEFIFGKQLIGAGKTVNPDMIPDLSIPMKQFMAA